MSHGGAAGRGEIVVESGQDSVVPDEAVVADHDPTLVLERTAGIDEDALSQSDVLAEVGVERWEHRHGIVDGCADEPPQQLPDLRGFVIAAVQLARDPQGVLTGAVHDRVQR